MQFELNHLQFMYNFVLKVSQC